MSVDSATLYEWIEALGELDGILVGIQPHTSAVKEAKQLAAARIDSLERAIHQRYLDLLAAETRCACAADTDDAATIPAPLSQVRSA